MPSDDWRLQGIPRLCGDSTPQSQSHARFQGLQSMAQVYQRADASPTQAPRGAQGAPGGGAGCLVTFHIVSRVQPKTSKGRHRPAIALRFRKLWNSPVQRLLQFSHGTQEGCCETGAPQYPIVLTHAPRPGHESGTGHDEQANGGQEGSAPAKCYNQSRSRSFRRLGTRGTSRTDSDHAPLIIESLEEPCYLSIPPMSGPDKISRVESS